MRADEPDIAADREGSEHVEAILAAVEFRVDVTREPGVVWVCPVGEVDVATIALVRERMDEAMATADSGRVLLDLRETTFVDSTVLHLAVDTSATAAADGIEFALVAGPPAVQRAFDAAGLSGRLKFVDAPRSG